MRDCGVRRQHLRASGRSDAATGRCISRRAESPARIKKTLGDTCIDTRSLLDTDPAMPGIQPSCVAEDVRDSDPTAVAVSFELVVDERICPYYPDHLRFVPYRDAAPAPDAWTYVRCELAAR